MRIYVAYLLKRVGMITIASFAVSVLTAVLFVAAQAAWYQVMHEEVAHDWWQQCLEVWTAAFGILFVACLVQTEWRPPRTRNDA